MFASGEDCSKIEPCGFLHQREQHSQSIVKRLAFLRWVQGSVGEIPGTLRLGI